MKESAERFVTLMVDILEKGIENIPPYVSNLLFRYSMLNLAYVAIGLTLFIVAGILWKKASKIDDFDDRIIPYVFGVLLSIGIGLALIGHNLQDVFIPEIWIISLLKQEM